ncbi:hypothetical protein C8F04DRAFT_581316 [Mycena alexandri]|uniref:Uncharacterized protein n=1 Tax=Mycena alexandri TaxID=1745969 RepID=A0AAD6RWA0_9AGAR|nr:hypothetical protein C8F04DRAFT_581316 [Mycena alexandri]
MRGQDLVRVFLFEIGSTHLLHFPFVHRFLGRPTFPSHCIPPVLSAPFCFVFILICSTVLIPVRDRYLSHRHCPARRRPAQRSIASHSSSTPPRSPANPPAGIKRTVIIREARRLHSPPKATLVVRLAECSALHDRSHSYSPTSTFPAHAL